MKKLLIIVASVLVLLVAAAFIAPKVMDWNGYKAEVAQAVKDATGRDLVIEGDIEVSLLPTPSFSASGIRFSNAQGASEPDMARLESMEVSLALFPLISGQIKVESIVLNRPVIALEKFSDGSANWELGTASSGEASGQGGAPAISLDDVQINDGTIIYRDATSGEEQRIEALNAQLSAGSLAGPYKLDGSAKLRDLAMTLKIDVASPDAAGVMPVALTLGLPDSGAEARLEGSYGADAFTGTLALKGSNLAAALAQLSGGGDQPALLQAPFSFQSALSASPSEVSLPGIVLGLGEDQGSGSIMLTLQPAMTLNAALKMERLDLDRILAAATPVAGTTATDGGEAAAGPLFPAGMTGGIALDVGEVIYRGEKLQGVKLAAQLADGVLTLEEAKALLPGGSDFRLSGALQDSSEGPSFVGALELVSDDPRTLARWAGADVAAVPEGKLQSFSLVSQLSLAGQQLSLTGTEIAFDETTASGGVTLALAEKPAFGLGLVVDKIDLDAYLPPASGDGSDGGDPFAFLNAFDANLDIKVGEAIYRGDRLNNIRLDATVANGAVTFRQASVGDIGGSSFSYSGSLAAGPSVNGQLTAKVADAAALSGLLGEETTGALAPLGPFTFDAKVGGTAAKMDLDGVLEAKGGRFVAKGTIDQAGGPAFDLDLAVRHPDLPALLTAMGSDGSSLPAALSSIDLAGHFKGTPSQITASQLSGSLGEIDLSGGFTLDLTGKPTIAADLSTGGIDLSRFSSGGSDGGSGERWSREPIDLSALGLVDGTVKIAAASVTDGELRLNNAIIDAVLTGGILNINRLAGEIYGGQLELTGQVDGRATPTITAAFSISNLDLGEYLKSMVPVGIPLGRLSAQGQISSVGASEADLVAALNGALTADGLFRLDTGGIGAIAGIGGKTLGKVAEGLLGIGGTQVSNIADAGSLLLAALADYDTPLTTRISIQNGKALIEQAELKPRGMTALASGVADLLPFTGDINLAVFLNDNPDEPYYLEQRSGLLDDPDIFRSGLVTSGEAKQDLPELTELDPSQIPAEVVGQLIPEGVDELVPGGASDLLGGLLGTGEGEAPTPVVIEEQPAEVVEAPAPEVVEEPAPVVVEEPAPVVVEEPAPAVIEEPAPVVVEEPAPVVVEEPAPVVVEEPAPVVVEEPASAVVEEPAPAVVEEPAPAVVEEPAPAVVEEPAPAVVEEATPVIIEEPAPEVAEAPAEAPTEEPAPAAAPDLGPVLPAILEQVFGP